MEEAGFRKPALLESRVTLRSKRDSSAAQPGVQTTHARKNRATPVGMTGRGLGGPRQDRGKSDVVAASKRAASEGLTGHPSNYPHSSSNTSAS